MSTTQLVRPQTRTTERVYTPRADLYTSDDALILKVDLPGVPAEGLSVMVEGNQLHLEGKRSDSLKYRRVLRLPDGLDTDAIEAVLKNGELTVTLPKVAKLKPRRIEVKG